MGNVRGDIHIDVALSNVAVAYENRALIAARVLPVIPVAKQSDKYYIFGKEAFNLYDDLRANGAEAKEVMSYSVGTGNYFCDPRALKDIITDQDRNNADFPIQPDTLTTEQLVKMRLLRLEYIVGTTLFNTTTFAGYTSTLSGTNKWSDYDNSDPCSDIETARASVEDNTGVTPNVGVCGAEVWRKLKHHPDLLDRIKHVKVGSLSKEQVADLFELDELIVGGSMYNAAPEDTSSTFTPTKIWGNYFLTYYRAPGKQTLKTPNMGIIPSWKLYGKKAYKVKKYRWEPRGGDMVEVESAYDVKITLAAAGYLHKDLV